MRLPPLPSPLNLEGGGFSERLVLFTVSYSLRQVAVVPWICQTFVMQLN